VIDFYKNKFNAYLHGNLESALKHVAWRGMMGSNSQSYPQNMGVNFVYDKSKT
jgi:hypothetical protein